jgi:transcriptional regulator with XRE-family HTH domain
MKDLKEIIASNITMLRKSKKMTQLELSKELNYSDKAISKWERAESIPDIIVLKQISDFFGVTVDYLLCEHNEGESLIVKETKAKKAEINKFSLTLLSVSPVWIIATIIFTVIAIFLNKYIWYVFFISVPITILLFLIFNSIWGNKRFNYFIISCFIWSILLVLYIAFINYNIWQIFILGIPAQITIFLWARLKVKR